MMLISHLAVLFYVTLTMLLGVFLLLFVSHGVPHYYPIQFPDVAVLIHGIYFDAKLRLISGVAGIVILFLNYIFMKALSDNHQRERTIAFDNPAGRVSVSLSALEDLTRRVITSEPEIKEARAMIRARKKTIDIAVRLILSADVNIPELTARLQDIVRRRIQEIIGIEETILVRMHVSKISPVQKKLKKGKDEDATPEPGVPFYGYRA